MDAAFAPDPSVSARQRATARMTIQHAIANVLVLLLAVGALTLAVRRLTGSLVEPLSPTGFVLVTLVGAWMAGVARFAFLPRLERWPHGMWTWRRFLAINVLPTGSLLAIVAALAVPGTSPRAVVVALLVVAAEELLAWWAARPVASRSNPTFEHATPLTPPAGNAAAGNTAVISAPESFYQIVVRTRSDEGSERLEARCRTVFQPGQRHATEHLAFCPPFAAAPEITCEVLEGARARIRVTRSFAHGARLELRLPSAASEPAEVTFRLVAAVPAAMAAAEG